MNEGNAGADAGRTLTVRVPLQFQKRGGRKQIVFPDGESLAQPRLRVDNTLIKALARAFRWRRLLDLGEFATLAELAAHERISPSYLTRVLRLTLLAPDLIEAILEGRQGHDVTLARLMQPFPAAWNAHFGQDWQGNPVDGSHALRYDYYE